MKRAVVGASAARAGIAPGPVRWCCGAGPAVVLAPRAVAAEGLSRADEVGPVCR